MLLERITFRTSHSPVSLCTGVPVCFSPYQKFPPGELCPRLDFPREEFCPRIIFPPAGQNSPTSIPGIRVFQATSSNKNLATIMTNECDETTIIFVVRNHNFFVWFQCSQGANSLVG